VVSELSRRLSLMFVLHEHSCETEGGPASAVATGLLDVASASDRLAVNSVLRFNFFNQSFDLEHTHEELVNGLLLC
jgi:hypothetical protein